MYLVFVVLGERLFEVFFRQLVLAGTLVDQRECLENFGVIGIDRFGQLQITLGSFPVAFTNILPGQGHSPFQRFFGGGFLGE